MAGWTTLQHTTAPPGWRSNCTTGWWKLRCVSIVWNVQGPIRLQGWHMATPGHLTIHRRLRPHTHSHTHNFHIDSHHISCASAYQVTAVPQDEVTRFSGDPISPWCKNFNGSKFGGAQVTCQSWRRRHSPSLSWGRASGANCSPDVSVGSHLINPHCRAPSRSPG